LHIRSTLTFSVLLKFSLNILVRGTLWVLCWLLTRNLTPAIKNKTPG
jgi:hypothetical protein